MDNMIGEIFLNLFVQTDNDGLEVSNQDGFSTIEIEKSLLRKVFYWVMSYILWASFYLSLGWGRSNDILDDIIHEHLFKPASYLTYGWSLSVPISFGLVSVVYEAMKPKLEEIHVLDEDGQGKAESGQGIANNDS